MKTVANSLSRNAPCWCGSGKKFKKCHLGKEQIQSPPIQEKTQVVNISGFLGKPSFARKTRGEQFFFVNNIGNWLFILSPFFSCPLEDLLFLCPFAHFPIFYEVSYGNVLEHLGSL